jgi:hypothetical protein
MKVTLTLTAEMESPRFIGRSVVITMNEWPTQMADRIRKQQSEKANDNAAFLEQQRIKKEFGPLLWQQVVSEAKNNCTRLNMELGGKVATVEATPISELSIRATTSHISRVRRRAQGAVLPHDRCWRTDDSMGSGFSEVHC